MLPRPIPHRPVASFSPHTYLPAHAKSHQPLTAALILVYSILTHAARSGGGGEQFREWLTEQRVGTQADDSELPYLLCWANSPVSALPTPSALNERKGQGPAAQALVLPAGSPEPPWPAMEAEPHLLTRGSEPQTAWNCPGTLLCRGVPGSGDQQHSP